MPCDLAFPCATQNELEEEDARAWVDNGCFAVCEGANMPTTPAAIKVYENTQVLHAPSKAANAGGVAVSGLEMSQNSLRMGWGRAEVDSRLHDIMRGIHNQSLAYGAERDYVNYCKGANIAGCVKVADAMLAYGVM